MGSHTPTSMEPEPFGACAEHKLSVPDDTDHTDPNDRANRVQRAQWLRAAILGANDGLLSTTSLMLGVGAAKEDRWSMILSGVAGAVAGACSMAVGEFVSVSTQRDIEKVSAHQKDCATIATTPITECSKPKVGSTDWSQTEWATPVMTPVAESSKPKVGIKDWYQTDCATPVMIPVAGSPKPDLGIKGRRSISISPAKTPARNLPLPSPGRSPMMRAIAEAGKNESTEDTNAGETLPNPIKAAAASGLAFMVGSLVPILSSLFVTHHATRVWVLILVTSIALAVFGGVGAGMGGSPVRVSAVRVLVGGWIAMAITYWTIKPLDRDD